MSDELARVMFVYWGRRGALTQFTLQVARTALMHSGLAATISVSRQNECFDDYREFGPALFPVDTFGTGAGAALNSWRIPLLRHRLIGWIRDNRTQAVIELMPHVWSPLVMPAVRDAGARYCTLIHDADPHTGDRTSWVKRLMEQALPYADTVLTLSEAVAARLVAAGRVPRSRVATLFHPDLCYGPRRAHAPPAANEPWRLLFLGRVLAYKGLPLFLDTVDLLRSEGHRVEVGVYGEGRLGPSLARLEALGASVVNRWLSGPEIADVLGRYHAVVLSHTNSSQSGVAAAAFGAGVPVVAVPVGGVIEQVVDGHTGALASRPDAPALAETTKRLLLNPGLYRDICATIERTREQRSMQRFIEACVSRALQPNQALDGTTASGGLSRG